MATLPRGPIVSAVAGPTWLRLERVMGIEPTSGRVQQPDPKASLTHTAGCV
jgi:hypothetical protein